MSDTDYYTPPTLLTREEIAEEFRASIEIIKRIQPSHKSSDVLPCPNCSYLDRVDGKPDKIRNPSITEWRRAKLWYTSECCQLSRGLSPVATKQEALDQWNERRTNFDILPEISREKPRATYEKMEQKLLQ